VDRVKFNQLEAAQFVHVVDVYKTDAVREGETATFVVSE